MPRIAREQAAHRKIARTFSVVIIIETHYQGVGRRHERAPALELEISQPFPEADA